MYGELATYLSVQYVINGSICLPFFFMIGML